MQLFALIINWIDFLRRDRERDTTLLYSSLLPSVWIPVILLFVPFFALCFSVGFGLTKQKRNRGLDNELSKRKIANVQYEKMNLKDFQIGEDLSLAFRPFHCIPNGITKSRRVYNIKKVDLTETFISDLSNLRFFVNLETLVLDKNELETINTCPVLEKVHTLWCNNNKISHLEHFLSEISDRFPNLQYISLMRNPVSIFESENESRDQPSYISEQMIKYRLCVIQKLPTLQMLDSVKITNEEVIAAKLLGSHAFLSPDSSCSDEGLDEDAVWKYPTGFIPPGTVSKDSAKKICMRMTQKMLEETLTILPTNKSHPFDKTNNPLLPLRKDQSTILDCWQLAKESGFELNKRTVWRYHEASLWQAQCKKRSHWEAILETMRWRYIQGFPIKDRLLLETEMSTNKMFHLGKALDGKPLLYLFLARENTWNAKNNMKCLLYTMERCIANIPSSGNELICLIDAKDLGMMNAPAVQFIGETIDVLSKHYPRRMGQLFVINVSSIVFWFWDLISMSLSEVTRKKIQFLTDNKVEMRTRIGEYISMEELLPEFGGSRLDMFNLEAYLSADEMLMFSLLGTQVVQGVPSVNGQEKMHVQTDIDDRSNTSRKRN